jgi:hypothetical protein
VITVRFTLYDVVLSGVNFRRTAQGDPLAPTTCVNCVVRAAVLRGADGRSPVPPELGAGSAFEAVLRVDALSLERFTVRFDLVAEAIRIPEVVPILEETLTAGHMHTCGLTVEGRAYCWGNNYAGALGDGTKTNRLVPTPVAGGLTFR